MVVKWTGTKVALAVGAVVLVAGMVQGAIKHSLPQVLFTLAALIGLVGFWRNPHYLGSRVATLPQEVARSYDRVGHLCFRASTLLMLAAICAFAVAR